MHGMDSDLIAELSLLKNWLVDSGKSSGVQFLDTSSGRMCMEWIQI